MLACEGSRPIHVAVSKGALPGFESFALSCCSLLVAHGASPFDRDDHQRTPLHLAAALGLEEVAAYLLQAAAQQRAQAVADKARLAAAMEAENGSPDEYPVPEPLVVLQDTQGQTALHAAARFGAPVLPCPLCCGGVADVELLQASTASWSSCWQPQPPPRRRARAPLPSAASAPRRARPPFTWLPPGAAPSAPGTGARPGRAAARLCLERPLASACRLLVAAAPALVDEKDKKGHSARDTAQLRGFPAVAAAMEGRAAEQPGATCPCPSRAPSPSSSRLRLLAGAADESARTVIVAPPACLDHRTCAEPITRSSNDVPPENSNRLRVLTTEGRGILRSTEFADLVGDPPFLAPPFSCGAIPSRRPPPPAVLLGPRVTAGCPGRPASRARVDLRPPHPAGEGGTPR